MFCIAIVLTLSLALIVLMGGLFLLAYSKKENLGWMSKITSYVAITFGSVLFIGCLVACITCGTCGKSKCGKNQGSCSTEMRKDCSGNSCGSGKMDGHHRMGAMGHCEKGDEACCKGEKSRKKMKMTKPDSLDNQ